MQISRYVLPISSSHGDCMIAACNQDNINALVNSFETITSSPLNLSDTINSITSALKNSIHENLRKETILGSINIPESVSNDTNNGSLGVSNDVVSGIQKVTVVPRVPCRQIQRDVVPLRNLPVQGSSTAFHKKKEKGNVIPPINVLIVEADSDTQLLLSTFMKEKDIKYECASNGQEAVDKWKKGGFHVILMATIMPVMDGIEATKTIRCLEKAQKIDFFPCLQPEVTTTLSTSLSDTSTHKLCSPVIIMALTASSSPSERHKVLAAGCNDFLTKPVNLELLEKKISDWGCMQALIDFDGWQRWKS
ncbi:3552_t:CDS:2, partial [Gigaspora margarita]